MTIEIFECAQGTAEWHECRRGIPTASEFHAVLARGEGKVRRSYMLKLAGEILTGRPMEGYESLEMRRGKENEAAARRRYAFERDCDVRQVGFIKNGRMGYSPDGLIGDLGLVEFKDKRADLQIDAILSGKRPTEHMAQCQGGLMVSGRIWVDVVFHCPELPLFITRIERDEAYIRRLRDEIEVFNAELDEVVAKIRRFGGLDGVAA